MTEPNTPPYPGPPRQAPKKPSTRTPWIIGGVVVALFAVFWVIGTVSGKDDEAAPAAASTSSSPSSSAAPAPTTAAVAPAETSTAATACYPPREISDPELAAFAAGLSLRWFARFP